MTAVALLNAEAGSAPSGTGSFTYFTNFRVAVENLAFAKTVGIWGRNTVSGGWGFFPCAFDHAVAGNREIWQAHVSGTEIDRFAVRYDVLGQTFWDNNAGFDYGLDTNAAHTDGIGTVVLAPAVLAVASRLDPGGTLAVDILVKNLAFAKQVAIVYTLNNWTTFQNAFAVFQRTFPPPTTTHQVQAEHWRVAVMLPPGASGQFAIFYIVAGNTFWDNNFRTNYSF
jgi:hypothetical protein